MIKSHPEVADLGNKAIELVDNAIDCLDEAVNVIADITNLDTTATLSGAGFDDLKVVRNTDKD